MELLLRGIFGGPVLLFNYSGQFDRLVAGNSFLVAGNPRQSYAPSLQEDETVSALTAMMWDNLNKQRRTKSNGWRQCRLFRSLKILFNIETTDMTEILPYYSS